ncbi:MAG: alpha-amylase family glycosyl hydrolase [Phycisphaerales bacterium]
MPTLARRFGVLAVLCACVTRAFGQATTESANAPAYQPLRERDEAGRVVGPERAGWWNDVVFYEVFVRSFFDSREGPKAGDGIGDLRGLIDRLDYLNDGDPTTDTDLGIGGIWLMPVMRSPSYHGYDVVDYLSIEEDYGTNEDFKLLVDACRKRGIRVIIDLVMNHTSSRHPAFIASMEPEAPEREWYIWTDANPGYRGPWGQQVWHRPRGERGGEGPAASGFYYGLFGGDMPDLNFRSPAATEMMLGVTRHWLTEYAIDGYRLDAVRHLIEEGRQQDNTLATHEWLKNYRSFYKGVNAGAMCIGEIWASTEVASSYVGDQVDLAFEFDLAQAMIDSARTGDAGRYRAAMDKVLRFFPPNQYGTFLTNHDQTRVMTQLRRNPGAMRVAAALLLTGPGVPFMYYGEEIGMTGDKPDPDLRTPMQWETEGAAGFTAGTPWRTVNADAAKGVSVAAQTIDPDSLLSWYRRLIRLRAGVPALASGSYTPIETGSPAVVAYHRSSGSGHGAVVVINLSAKAVDAYGLTLPASELRDKSGMTFLIGAEGAVPRPRLDDRGGFRVWRPLDPLPPHGVVVVEVIGPP